MGKACMWAILFFNFKNEFYCKKWKDVIEKNKVKLQEFQLIMIRTLPFQKTVNWIQCRLHKLINIDIGRIIYLFNLFFYTKKVLNNQLPLYMSLESYNIFCKVSHPNSSNMSNMQYNKIVDMWP